MLTWFLILAAFAAGLVLQRTSQSARLREAMWLVNYWAVLPALVFTTFLTFSFDTNLLVAIVASIVASWAMVGVSFLYARLVARERDEVGALAMGAAFGNTSFIGYPLANALFGQTGLNFAVVYDQLCFGVPMSSVTPVLARLCGRTDAPGQRSVVRTMFANPPLWALVAALALRFGGIGVPFAHDLETVGAALVGPLGFLMLGLSLPLDAIEHERSEVARAAGSIALRLAGGPGMLFVVGTLLGAQIPEAFYLIAATPTAFHLLVLARIYDVRPSLVRLQIVVSTPLMVALAVFLDLFVK